MNLSSTSPGECISTVARNKEYYGVKWGIDGESGC